MKRPRRAMAVLFVAIGSAALIFATAGSAAAQTGDDSELAGSADISNDEGAVVVHEDDGSAGVSNDEGAVLVHADDGSADVVNDSGAVAVWADGGSASVFNESGAVVVHSDLVRRRTSSRQPVFFHDDRFFHERVHVGRLTRLPATGVSLVEVLVMALAMIGIGVALLAAARIVPRFAAAP